MNTDSQNPIYDQIFTQISSQILSGSLKAGMQLPPIRTIANELKISVIPVKMAWEKLDHNGFIKTITGKGTFVAEISKEHIQSKIDISALELAEETARKAKALGLSFEDFCQFLKEKY